jgi:replicative DNA helicase
MSSAPSLALFPATEPKALPFNIEAEKALLGALMVENRLLEDVLLNLGEEHFYEPLHGRIFAQIRRLADLNMVASPVTLRPLFEADPALNEIGGFGYLLKLTEDPSVMLAARDCARQIYDLALLRALVLVGTELVLGATDTSAEVAPLKQIELAEEALYKVAETGDVSGSTQHFAAAAAKAVDMAARAMKSGGHLSGLTTGLSGLNGKIGGLHNSDLVIIAGRPAMGKTALATNIAFATALRAKQDLRDGISPSAGATVRRPAGQPDSGRTVADQQREPAHGTDQPERVQRTGAGGGESARPAAVDR